MKTKKTKKSVTKRNNTEKQEGLYQKAIAFAVDAIRSGLSHQVIAADLLASNERFNQASLQSILAKADAIISEQHVTDRASIVSIHVKRYNSQISHLLRQTYDNYPGHKKRQYRIEALMTVLDVMFAKEKVLQLHSKDNQIRIFNKINAKVEKKAPSFDLSTLTLQEKVEFLALLEKAKRNSGELMSVQLREQPAEVTQDIEHEEVATEKLNVEQIQQINKPQIEELHAVDEAKRKVPSPDEVFEKLKQAITKKAAEELKQKGAKINESQLFQTKL